MRSLNGARQGSIPTVQTVKPLSRCTTPASRCKPSHPSPSAHQFRLPFNWLAPSELRRIFCSDEGAGAAIDGIWGPSFDTRDGGLVHVSGRVNSGTIDTGHPHCSADPGFLRAGDTVETKRAAHRFSAYVERLTGSPGASAWITSSSMASSICDGS
jgi:hypothetical protein